VSVIGFDNITWPEHDSYLTTFKEPAKEMGRVAAQMLLERLLTGWKPVERREVPSPLVVRASAGPPSGKSDQNSTTKPLNLWPR
ncbi:MAG: LacI family DNA-binding transcriptional regulator, partial [Victivallales bacterium]|nr:LacI family DNA-binding transcriptional regulator [Victivallales bacterium]